MKKSIVIISMAAIVLLAASCKKEKATGTQTVKLTAGIEQTDGTKTEVINQVTLWKKGDAILANGNLLPMKELAEDRKTATFEGKWDLSKSPLPDGKNYICVVTPATEQKLVDEDWKSLVSVPKDQDYVDNGFMDNLPMGCHTQAFENIALHNLADVFCINVYAPTTPKTITRVEMEKVHSGQRYEDENPLAGTIWYPHAGQDLHGVEIVEGTTSFTISLNCKTEEHPSGVTISTSKDNPTPFYFATWPVQMGKGIVFRFYNEGVLVATIEHSIRPQDSVEPNTLYTVCQNNASGTGTGLPYNIENNHLIPHATDGTTYYNGTLNVKLTDINYGSGSNGMIGYLYCETNKLYQDPTESTLIESTDANKYEATISAIPETGFYCPFIRNNYGAFYGTWQYCQKPSK